MDNRIYLAFALVSLFFFEPISWSQEQRLTGIGARHWKTANTLWEMATTLEQKEMAVFEYEKVKESDPNYVETYKKLGGIFFELAKEFGEDKFYEQAKRNYNEYKSRCPQESVLIDDEIYIIESVRRLTQKQNAEVKKNSFVGVWVNRDFPSVSYIFRIKADGESYDVKVSTADERVLATLDVIYDGETLSFTVKDVDRMGTPHEISWGEGNGRVARVTCDLEEDYDYWKLKFKNGQLTANAECLSLYYYRGRVERRRSYNLTWVLSKR